MKQNDSLPFDGLAQLHDNQAPDGPDDILGDILGDSPTTKAEAADTAARRKTGGRKDLGADLDQIPGTRPVPYRLLSHGTKLARGRSMAAAVERRNRRRAESGITIHLDQRAYKRVGVERREAFDQSKPSLAYVTGRRWDFDADFYWLDDGPDAAQHLDCLFTSATRAAQPRQTFRQFLREQQS
jgi:hypothetical protein